MRSPSGQNTQTNDPKDQTGGFDEKVRYITHDFIPMKTMMHKYARPKRKPRNANTEHRQYDRSTKGLGDEDVDV